MSRFPRAKWKLKFLRLVYTAIAAYIFYRTLTFIHILYLNNRLGSPLDFSELMVEKEPRKFLDEFVRFKANFIPFDFRKIAAENEKMLQIGRKEFIRHTNNQQFGFIRK